MVHVALKLRSDILAQPVHQGLNVWTEDAIAYVPESLYMFPRLMLILENRLSDGDHDDKEEENDSDFINDDDDDDDDNDDEVHDDEGNDHCTDDDLDSIDAVDEEVKQPIRRQNARVRKQETSVFSVAQDLVYSVSGDRRWTPKHVGLGSSLHQVTRSKKLVETCHNAGHTISYMDVRRVDTALAKHTLSTMNAENGTVIPVNLAKGRFIHFTAANIDINKGTLDGQNTFHATQYAAWQRGPESVTVLQNITPTKRATLKVPDEMNAILPAYIREGTGEPEFKEDVKEEWFKQSIQDCPSALKAVAMDTTFFL